ncbi:DsbA family oxidoreductase [Mucilaginibacter aquaedulcis]|jgi:predicted DsbA family dithiol-disulfide isomerase|uniref:DsbA family oxidoreductase n=1 Tax=Mucilaginibacter aquaedulcis TaxID=1187081 RepID=UPI0025B478BD|nr:DsbA family oxidoreductase [Mucilaginibacter aquaedulcis]MDN3549442.1 DsbA family oxidoreductase [Mucilaginibacter aquaedulcis]
MKVEIWSDVMCPFCYIGKRRFEDALQQSGHQDKIEIEWKSFQLNPHLKTDPSVNYIQYLADRKGWTIDYTTQMNDQIAQMASEVGLSYNSTRVVANSFNAHRLSHLAKKYNLGNEAEEALFKAHFIDAQNIDDKATLVKLGTEIGLNAEEIQQVLDSETYANEVEQDIAEAQHLGISGVPFFVMNNKYGVSGAQALPVFLETIEKSFAEWEQENSKPALTIIEGQSCTPDGDCN